MDGIWEGQPKATEHRTLGTRAWCFQCQTYCYPNMNCDCCNEAKGWMRLWLRPDGMIVDENEEPLRLMVAPEEEVNGIIRNK
jgi:hypothetical protein